MKMSEIKEIKTTELIERVEAEKAMLVKMRLNHTVSPLDNPLKMKSARRDIARMLTELNRRNADEKSKE
ncbi:MAG: 50S ribosomal protein L29 [Bacteroidales bacterium]